MPPPCSTPNSGHSPYVPDPQIQPLSRGIWVWQNYSKKVKADLFSSAIQTKTGMYLIDPIPCPEAELRCLTDAGPIAGVIVTNMNHWRSAAEYSDRFSAPIFSRATGLCHPVLGSAKLVKHGSVIGGELQVIELPGAGPAEIALYHAGNGGTIIVGDALINFEPYGFTFLPKKYCENERQMRESLRQLLDKPAERMLFAHGMPISSNATARLRQLLESQ